ncbi:MAG: ATP-binding protein [Desulfovibrionaceae bacterium]|nr:ATP-binding protein [Desulfovibrionaceae bacterium]
MENLIRQTLDAAEEKIASLEERLRLIEAARDEFVANISHEIRTPMNIMIGMLHLALQTELSGKQREYIEKASNSAKNLARIFEELLDFSDIRSGRLQADKASFRLGDLVNKAMDGIRDRAEEKKLALKLNWPEGKSPTGSSWPEARFVGAPARLGQVLAHLLENAVKFTERGEVSLTVQEEGQPQAAGDPDQETVLRFSVADTGVGISREDQAALFNPFRQIDGSATRSYGGTGLGLFVCRRLVEILGGQICCESEAGKGTVFHFTIRCLPDSGSSLVSPVLPVPPVLTVPSVQDDADPGASSYQSSSAASGDEAGKACASAPVASGVSLLCGVYEDEAALRQHLCSKATFYMELFGKGRKGFSEQLDQLLKLTHGGAWEEARMLAHGLTGQITALGAEKARLAAEDYEHALHLCPAQPEKLEDFLRRLREILEEVEADLSLLMDELGEVRMSEENPADQRILLDFLSELYNFAQDGKLIDCKKTMARGKDLAWPAERRKLMEEMDYAVSRYDLKKAMNLSLELRELLEQK